MRWFRQPPGRHRAGRGSAGTISMALSCKLCVCSWRPAVNIRCLPSSPLTPITSEGPEGVPTADSQKRCQERTAPAGAAPAALVPGFGRVWCPPNVPHSACIVRAGALQSRAVCVVGQAGRRPHPQPSKLRGEGGAEAAHSRRCQERTAPAGGTSQAARVWAWACRLHAQHASRALFALPFISPHSACAARSQRCVPGQEGRTPLRDAPQPLTGAVACSAQRRASPGQAPSASRGNACVERSRCPHAQLRWGAAPCFGRRASAGSPTILGPCTANPPRVCCQTRRGWGEPAKAQRRRARRNAR